MVTPIPTAATGAPWRMRAPPAATLALMFHVVLVEPEIPPNTGNIIRLCANTGSTLHLVRPLGFRLDAKSLKRSGLDYHELAEVRVHARLDTCLETLAGSRWLGIETAGTRPYTEERYRAGDALVFGSETRGLSEQALAALGGRAGLLRIPMSAPASRSLNLSNAVAVVVYEAWRQLAFAGSTG
jgi:tRNA (cytidine/uridine-2'-O-)-methyltransferase